ncbi:MAG: hypothetical protein ABL957_06540 [Parvularculaceae bacterium]
MAKRPSKKSAKRPVDTERYTSAEYRPYVMAIGQVALAWNDLHETLGEFFYEFVGGAPDDKMEAVWQSHISDRGKRAMLKATVNEMSAEEHRFNPKAKSEMAWLFGQVDRLEEARNNVIHAPLSSLDWPQYNRMARLMGLPPKPEGVRPADLRGNRQAVRLQNKNLLAEYRLVRDEVMIFRDYVEAIADAWNGTYIHP